jgi:hypothetical protein
MVAALHGTFFLHIIGSAIFFLKHQLAFWILALLSYGIGRRLTSRITYACGWEKVAFSVGIGLGALGYVVFVLGMLHGIKRVFLIPILLIIAVSVSPAWKEAAAELTAAWHRARYKPWLVGAALVGEP